MRGHGQNMFCRREWVGDVAALDVSSGANIKQRLDDEALELPGGLFLLEWELSNVEGNVGSLVGIGA